MVKIEAVRLRYCAKEPLTLLCHGISKEFVGTIRSAAGDFCVHGPSGGWSVKIVNDGVVSPYPARSIVDSDSGSLVHPASGRG